MIKNLFKNKKLLIIIASAIVLVGALVAIILVCINANQEDPYEMKLNEFSSVIADPNNADALSDGLSAVRAAALEFGDDALDKLGYVCQDLNDDGKEELFIGCFENEKDSDVKNEIYAAFTSDGDSLTPIFEKQKRNTFALTDKGTIYFYGTDEAKYYILAEYQLTDEGELVCKDFYFTYPKDGDGNNFAYYHNTTGVWDSEGSEEIQMTPEEFEAKRKALAAKTDSLDDVKFSEVK